MTLILPPTRPLLVRPENGPGRGPVPRRAGRRVRVPRGLRSLAGIVMMAVLVGGPGYLFAALTVATPGEPAVSDQVDVAGRAPDPALVARLRAAPTDPHFPPAVITYHDIAVHGSQYTVTPQAFADQMRLLHDSGWHTLRADEFTAWQHGASLPPHSVLLTFDDGARGVWQYADPVLRRYGMRGVAFIITGFVGTHVPYYMTWSELHRLRTDGRWDLEAHTYLGHVQVAADAAGDRLPFLSTTEWLPALHRQETTAEFDVRVRDDLQHCIDDLVAHGVPRPTLFAYPFSAVGSDLLGTHLHTIVDSLFGGAFLDSPAGRPTSLAETGRREFRRVDLLRTTSADDFVTDVEDSLQHTVYPLRAAAWRAQEWLATTSRPAHVPAVGPVPLSTAVTGDRWGEIQLDPDYTSYWTDYRAEIGLTGLSDDVSGSVYALLGSPDQVQVVVGRSFWIIYREVTSVSGSASRLVARGDLTRPSGHHTVRFDVRPGSVRVFVDGALLDVRRTGADGLGGIAVSGDPLRQPRPPVLAGVTVTPLETTGGIS